MEEISELPAPVLRDAVEAYKRQLISTALGDSGGNWTHAARRLGLDRANLQRLARRLGV